MLSMDQLQDKMRILYQKGMSAFKAGNLDYAITLFTTVLDESPDYAPARTQLRLAEFRKYKTSKFHFYIPSIKATYYTWKKDWLSVLRELEKSLKRVPKNYRLLRKLAHAAEKANMPETVCSIYETMYLVKPTDIFVLKKLGKYYHQLEQPDKARSYYERALAIAPLDYEARKGLQNLAALNTISRGWEEEGTYREKLQDEKQADLFEKETRLIRSIEDRRALIADVEKRFKEQPKSIPLIRKLAELYFSVEEYPKSIELYERAAKLDPADASLRKDILNVKIAQLDKQGSVEEKKKLILEDTQKRVKDFPTHLLLRYELGIIYMQREMWNEAISELQISVKDPKYKILSLNSLGLCFYKKGIHDLAIKQFQKAANELYEWDELKKEVIYNLGTVYEAMGEKEKATEEYKKIYEQDINYRDISRKIT